MKMYLEHPVFGISVTLASYFLAVSLKKFWNYPFLNPVLLSILLIIFFLKIVNVDFQEYNNGGKFLSFFLAPSVVAMGVFLYEKYKEIRKNLKIFFLAVGLGGLTGILSMVMILLVFNSPKFLINSLAAKSVTTPIAIEITKIVGGIPEITAGIVIVAGILGNVLGIGFLNKLGIKNEAAIGAALGTASHGIGTARAFEHGKIAGVYSGLAMCVNGIITATITPYLIKWLL